jgi:hypothetical protein
MDVKRISSVFYTKAHGMQSHVMGVAGLIGDEWITCTTTFRCRGVFGDVNGNVGVFKADDLGSILYNSASAESFSD